MTSSHAVTDQNVDLLEALEQRLTHAVEIVELPDIGGHQCGLAAKLLDLVVEFFEGAGGAGKRDDMRALRCQRFRDGGSDAA